MPAAIDVPMPSALDELYKGLIQTLDGARHKKVKLIHYSQEAINIVQFVFAQLKSYIVQIFLKDENEEFLFFMEIKLRFYTQFIYHLVILRIGTYQPNRSVEAELFMPRAFSYWNSG